MSNSNFHVEGEWRPSQDILPPSRMAAWVMRNFSGIIKTEHQANIVLLIFAVMVIAVTVYLFFSLSIITIDTGSINEK